jgi:hypothetical protein
MSDSRSIMFGSINEEEGSETEQDGMGWSESIPVVSSPEIPPGCRPFVLIPAAQPEVMLLRISLVRIPSVVPLKLPCTHH